MRLLLRLLVAVIAGLAGWLGSGAPDAVAAPSSPPATYAYDRADYIAATLHATTERGPPAITCDDTFYAAVHRWSRGASTGLQGVRAWPTTSHTAPAEFVQVAGPTTSSVEPDAGTLGTLPVISRESVAANTAARMPGVIRVGELNGNLRVRSGGMGLSPRHFDEVVSSNDNIARTFTSEHDSFQIRDSLFSGPGGFLKFESTWQVTDGGLRLTRVIPMGGR